MKKIYVLAFCCMVLGWALPACGYDGVDIPAIKRMAEQGDAESQSRLGALYASGVGLPMDKKEAIAWYTKAAAQESPLGMWNLAFMLVKGDGVPIDYLKALVLFRKAAEKGLDMAQYDVGMMYLQGLGTPADRAEAEKWFHKAADQGYRNAERMLVELAKQ